MRKKPNRWPIWKIVVALVGTAAAAVGLAWLSTIVESMTPAGAPTGGDTQQPAGMSLASLLFIFAMASAMMTILCVGWLIHRWRRSIPPWKRSTPIRPKRR